MKIVSELRVYFDLKNVVPYPNSLLNFRFGALYNQNLDSTDSLPNEFDTWWVTMKTESGCDPLKLEIIYGPASLFIILYLLIAADKYKVK